jgi:hypothetical protein
MPNWCSNQATFAVQDDNLHELIRLKQAFEEGSPFNFYLPVPEHDSDTLDEYIKRWGTKWDLDEYDDTITINKNSFSLVFQTAWTPPIPFYEELNRIGIDVHAYYLEPGCDFCGHYVDGVDHYFDGLNLDDPDIADICFAMGYETFEEDEDE